MFNVVEIENPSLTISISLPNLATKIRREKLYQNRQVPYNNGRGGMLFHKLHEKRLKHRMHSPEVRSRRIATRENVIDQSQHISKSVQASLLQLSTDLLPNPRNFPPLIKPIPLNSRDLFWTPNRETQMTWVESYTQDKYVFLSPIVHYANKLTFT